MAVKQRMVALADRIANEAQLIDSSSIVHMMSEIRKATRIFLCGAGRSGFVARAFAMRLMHLGFSVHVVGEATAPAIEKGDLLVAVSGSGETYSIVGIADATKKKGAAIIAITSSPSSTLAKLANAIVQIKGRLPAIREKDYLARQMKGGHEPIAPMGTLFELSAMVFFDSLVEELMIGNRKSEHFMRRRHTNLE
jgi:6-phospho 3-hexuloisomerase